MDDLGKSPKQRSFLYLPPSGLQFADGMLAGIGISMPGIFLPLLQTGSTFVALFGSVTGLALLMWVLFKPKRVN